MSDDDREERQQSNPQDRSVIYLRVEDHLREALDREADHRGISLNRLCREVLEAFIFPPETPETPPCDGKQQSP